LNDIGRNSLLGNRKKIAKFLMRTFTCRSTFLYDYTTAFTPSIESRDNSNRMKEPKILLMTVTRGRIISGQGEFG
jgi:hypothetical protein